MKFNPKIHHRRSIRLQGYDYSQAGAYFVTMCTRNRECLLGKIIDGQMVQTIWDEIPMHYPGIDIDKFIIMPNHIHGIVVVVGAAPRGRPEHGQPRDDGQPQGCPYRVIVAGCCTPFENPDHQTLRRRRKTKWLATVSREIMATQLLGTRRSQRIRIDPPLRIYSE
jgi:hypothetical protein